MFLPDPADGNVGNSQQEELELELSRKVDKSEEIENHSIVCENDVG